MRLWTIQPLDVYDLIIKEGEYICDDTKSEMLKERYVRTAYDWLVKQMAKRIGNPPEGVTYPVWAYVKKPDFTTFDCYNPDKSVCIEFEIDEKDVLVTNHDGWSVCPLNLGPYITGETDEEFDRNYDEFEALPWKEQEIVMYKSWEKLILPTDYSGPLFTQATFWKLKASQIISVDFLDAKKERLFNEE